MDLQVVNLVAAGFLLGVAATMLYFVRAPYQPIPLATWTQAGWMASTALIFLAMALHSTPLVAVGVAVACAASVGALQVVRRHRRRIRER